MCKRDQIHPKMKPSTSHKVIISHSWEKGSIFTTEAHRWRASSHPPPNKNKIRNPIKERLQPIRFQVLWQQQRQIEPPLVARFTGGASNWLRASGGFIASMATLLPYCLGRWKGGEEGRRLSLRRYLCIIHPLSPRACGDAPTVSCPGRG